MDQIGSSNKDNKDNKDYKDTLHLPKTDYPMRAGLAEREPHQVKKWIDDRVYYRMVEKNRAQKAPRFLLHDGPPYANGNIHIGHALNKVLKDVVVKYKNMSGFESQFIPGWDCHGLPIELGVEKQLLEQKKDKASFAVTELRQLCRDYAKRAVRTPPTCIIPVGLGANLVLTFI
jgi:isoleucyl-tRNA synthetase